MSKIQCTGKKVRGKKIGILTGKEQENERKRFEKGEKDQGRDKAKKEKHSVNK